MMKALAATAWTVGFITFVEAVGFVTMLLRPKMDAIQAILLMTSGVAFVSAVMFPLFFRIREMKS